MKVAIVHDWLTGMRGGEKCLEVFCELFPTADLFTLVHLKGKMSQTIERMNIQTSFLQHLPFVEHLYRSYLPLMPTAIEAFDLTQYDLVLSSSHCVAKGVMTRPDTCHICYCYTPMRYAWDQYHLYFSSQRAGRVSKFLLPPIFNYLRLWDVISAARVDHFVSISHHVARRIWKYYRRRSEVIYPPVNTSFFTPEGNPEDYFLLVSALVPYKRTDLAIEVFNRAGWPLKIIGNGPEERNLKAFARRNIEFLGWRSDEELRSYYARCRALIFPGEEDFGIVPLEAQATGRPVIAFGQGGVLETVIPLNGEDLDEHSSKETLFPTGLFFREQTPDALLKALTLFEKSEDRFQRSKIREHALKFERSLFKEKIERVIVEKFQEYGATGSKEIDAEEV
ncbi:MAG: glycosyltransferase [Candidatus Tectomicrobia bacterium]|nr:glycosyltransferase [Candidatus Tectomicrobia bacterium]